MRWPLKYCIPKHQLKTGYHQASVLLPLLFILHPTTLTITGESSDSTRIVKLNYCIPLSPGVGDSEGLRIPLTLHSPQHISLILSARKVRLGIILTELPTAPSSALGMHSSAISGSVVNLLSKILLPMRESPQRIVLVNMNHCISLPRGFWDSEGQ